VADGGEMWRHFTQQVTKGPHRSREPQLLFKPKSASRFRE